ncbi:MAG TPA: hypothetical protein VFF07_04760 [Actinomycetota bacterium]|nr:hypothetical protein [Actinomycetota bacterium]
MGDEAAGAIRFESTAGRWIVAVSVLGSGIAFLEATVVNVALPEIGRDLEADTGALQWTLNGYLVTLSALILLGGSLGDRFGRRLVSTSASSGSQSPRWCARSRRRSSCWSPRACCRGWAGRC